MENLVLVLSLNTNEGNESSVIKFKDKRFLLKNIGIGGYGTERVANLFIMLPNGDKAFVQTICFLKMLVDNNISESSKYKGCDCYVRVVAPFEDAVEHSKNFISILYGE